MYTLYFNLETLFKIKISISEPKYVRLFNLQCLSENLGNQIKDNKACLLAYLYQKF